MAPLPPDGSLLRLAPKSANGRWRLHIRHEDIEILMQELDRSSNRPALSIVIAAIIAGRSVVICANAALTRFKIKIQYEWWSGI